MSERLHSVLAVAIVALWPFVFFARSIVPEQSWSLAIYNDFIPLYYHYKLYLLDMLSAGHWPLWSPMEGAGYPFFASPYTQALYPLNVPLAAVYDTLGGYTRFDHQLFTVAGLSIFAVGLYAWLRQLEGNRLAVVFAVVIVTVSFKLGEILRFPNAVHTAAWIPWLLLGVTLMRRRARLMAGAGVTFVASFMILTGGYPYFAYYLLFLVPPYVLLLAFRPAVVRTVDAHPRTADPGVMRYLAVTAGASLGAAVILAPYLLKMLLLLSGTTDRAGESFEYATRHPFTPVDTLASLVYPPAASSEGWFFFSTPALALALFGLALPFIVRSARRPDAALVWLSGGVFAFVTLIAWGPEYGLFELLWHTLPGFDRLRVWGRINIILLPLIAWLLVRGTTLWLDTVELSRARRLMAGVVVCTAAAHLGVRGFADPDPMWTRFFASVADPGLFSGLALGGLAVLVAATFALPGLSQRHPRPRRWGQRAAVLAIALAAIVELYPVGARQWMSAPLPGYPWARERLNAMSLMSRTFETPRVRIYDSLNTEDFNVGWFVNWYFQRYLAFDRAMFVSPGASRGALYYGGELPVGQIVDADALAAYREFMGLETGARLFLTRALEYPGPAAFMTDARTYEQSVDASIDVVAYDGDTLVVNVRSGGGWLSFIDNWDPDWRACIGTHEVPLARLFGTFKSVQVPPGNHRVLFTYAPWPFRSGAVCTGDAT